MYIEVSVKRFIFSLLCLVVTHVIATEWGVITEAKLGYFYPMSHSLREIYGTGGINYGLSLTSPVWRDLNVWAAADYFGKTGHSVGGNQQTYIQIIPTTVGLKYIYPIKDFRVYGGLGFRYYYVRVVNSSQFVDHEVIRSGLGGIAEIGGMYCYKHLILDFFTSYSYKKFSKFHTHHFAVQTSSLQVGGWNFGGGIGYKF